MEEKEIDFEKVVAQWQLTSQRDLKVATLLISSHEYAHGLFFGHLAVEKILKALYVKQHDQHAPFTHNLLFLSQKSDLELSEEQTEWLIQINKFNIEARYDDVKTAFYEKCTPEFSELYINRIQSIYQWINSKL